MTLFSPTHATKVLALVAALCLGSIAPAAAGGGERGVTEFRGIHVPAWKRHRHDDRDWRRDRRGDRRHAERHRRHHWHKGGNFYGGAVTAWRDPGNGVYFYFDNGDVSGRVDGVFDRRRQRAKVIEVVPGSNGCSWEAGVCVVRP
ncbi:hypothetical protein [Shinella pollutisoli]|uniref:Secreted protein n=1 Tax=Shinella pollutisoli TaxID=2250594 RepID=A0ABV7DCA1_9HYPH|nr:hypothetical protein [Shinella pollutisoli]